MDELLQTRRFMRPALLGKASSAKLDDDSVELWEKTCKEADGRLLRGPFTVSEVDQLFPEGWTPVRRFGVRQSSGETTKLRPIMITANARLTLPLGILTRLILELLTSLSGF